MNVFLWIVQAVLAAMFVLAGIMKSTQPKEKLAPKLPWVQDFSAGTVRFIGVAELLGGLGLILPAATGIAPILTPDRRDLPGGRHGPGRRNPHPAPRTVRGRVQRRPVRARGARRLGPLRPVRMVSAAMEFGILSLSDLQTSLDTGQPIGAAQRIAETIDSS
jgi:hypothetical protein